MHPKKTLNSYLLFNTVKQRFIMKYEIWKFEILNFYYLITSLNAFTMDIYKLEKSKSD